MLYRVTTKDGETLEINAKNMKEAQAKVEETGKLVAMVTKLKSCSGD